MRLQDRGLYSCISLDKKSHTIALKISHGSDYRCVLSVQKKKKLFPGKPAQPRLTADDHVVSYYSMHLLCCGCAQTPAAQMIYSNVAFVQSGIFAASIHRCCFLKSTYVVVGDRHLPAVRPPSLAPQPLPPCLHVIVPIFQPLSSKQPETAGLLINSLIRRISLPFTSRSVTCQRGSASVCVLCMDVCYLCVCACVHRLQMITSAAIWWKGGMSVCERSGPEEGPQRKQKPRWSWFKCLNLTTDTRLRVPCLQALPFVWISPLKPSTVTQRGLSLRYFLILSYFSA